MSGTLLGPEGTACRCLLDAGFTGGWWMSGRCLRTAQWTRASVAKFLRARQPSFDPGVSEWGNPAVVMGCHPYLNT